MGSDGDHLYLCGLTQSFGDSTVFLTKYDKAGNLIWQALTDKAIKTRSMAFASDGSLYLAATTDNLGAGGEDLIIMQYDTATGALVEYRTWGGTANESVQDIRIKDGFMYLTGRTVSYSPSNSEDALLIKAPLFGTASASSPFVSLPLTLHPNPMSDQATLTFENNSSALHELTVVDAAGRLVREMKGGRHGKMTIEGRGLAPGMYFYRLSRDGKPLGQGKFVVE